MSDQPHGDDGVADDPIARSVLLGTAGGLRAGRRFFRALPSEPRCKLCFSPFGLPSGLVMRAIGKGPWPKNPKYCAACFRDMARYRSGAEIPCSLVFADVRGSTSLAETMRPGEFRAAMNRFFRVAGHALVEHDGIVDKFVGDEIIGIFIPALAGADHAAQAIAGALSLLAATRDATGLPVGAGVHSGIAFVGTVGDGSQIEFTAMGDPVNVAARLASAAGAGEALVSIIAAEAAGLDAGGLERRNLALKGKSDDLEVVAIRAGER